MNRKIMFNSMFRDKPVYKKRGKSISLTELFKKVQRNEID